MRTKITLNAFFIFSFFLFSLTQTFGANGPNPAGVGHMIPSVKAVSGGAEVTAKFHHAQLGSKISLSLLTEVTDQNGDRYLVELERFQNSELHSKKDYKQEFNYQLDYAEMNKNLKKMAPNGNLSIGEGTQMWLYARWMNDPKVKDPFLNSGSIRNHEWGGTSRNGGFVLPAAKGQSKIPVSAPSNTTSSSFNGGVTSALDVVNPVDAVTAGRYKGLSTQVKLGSRFENELKLHVDLKDFARVEKLLRELSKDPKKVEKLFGKGWTMREDTTYVGKPMIDVYLDNEDFDGAKVGMALRFRTGNGRTSLNYKPTDGKYEGDGVYARIEYEGENVSKPKDIVEFMDSDDMLNFMQLIRKHIPGSTPSDFTKKAVKITDERRKFKLKAPGGDEVEFSLDKYDAQKLNGRGQVTGPKATVGQLEVEVNHLGVGGSTNTVVPTGSKKWSSEGSTLRSGELTKFMKALESGSNLSGQAPPTFHGEGDFSKRSPIHRVNADNFKLANKVFGKVRRHLFGKDAQSSGQKYALAAAALGLVDIQDAAPSVQRMIKEESGKSKMGADAKRNCLLAMVKIGK